MYDKNFADYEIKEASTKFAEEEQATRIGCVGTFNIEMETKTITKTCEGVVAKKRTRGTGSGTATLNAHAKHSVLSKMLGMVQTALKDGIYAYGSNSKHEEFCFTAKVLDEDGNLKYIACPKMQSETGYVKNIENGAEEVAQGEYTLSIMPDEYGNGIYEMLDSEFTDETTKEQWLNNWSYDLVKADTV